MTTAGNRTRELVQQVLQSQWRQLGVDVRCIEPAAGLLRRDAAQAPLHRHGHVRLDLRPENAPRTMLHSEEIPTPENGWSGQNYTGYPQPAMDQLLDGIEVELDREKRRAVWHEVQQIYADDLPALPLFLRADAHIWPYGSTGSSPPATCTPVRSGSSAGGCRSPEQTSSDFR